MNQDQSKETNHLYETEDPMSFILSPDAEREIHEAEPKPRWPAPEKFKAMEASHDYQADRDFDRDLEITENE